METPSEVVGKILELFEAEAEAAKFREAHANAIARAGSR